MDFSMAVKNEHSVAAEEEVKTRAGALSEKEGAGQQEIVVHV